MLNQNFNYGAREWRRTMGGMSSQAGESRAFNRDERQHSKSRKSIIKNITSEETYI